MADVPKIVLPHGGYKQNIAEGSAASGGLSAEEYLGERA